MFMSWYSLEQTQWASGKAEKGTKRCCDAMRCAAMWCKADGSVDGQQLRRFVVCKRLLRDSAGQATSQAALVVRCRSTKFLPASEAEDLTENVRLAHLTVQIQSKSPMSLALCPI